MANCQMCGRVLNEEEDPLSVDCGGDCWGCVSEIEAEGVGVSLELYRTDPEFFVNRLRGYED